MRLIIISTIIVLISLNTYALPPEYSRIDEHKKHITKTKDGYIITPDSGNTITFTNLPHDGSYQNQEVIYHVLTNVILNQYAIFSVLGISHWRHDTLVDLKSGNSINISDTPHFSPSLQRFVVAAGSEMFDSSLTLYEKKNGKFETIFKVNNDDHGLPTFHSWNGNNEIRIIDFKYIRTDYMLLSYNPDLKNWEYKESNDAFPKK